MVVLDVVPFCVVQGDRATVRGLNLVGMRRMGLDRPTIGLIKEAFQTVFYSGLTLEEALRQPALTVSNPAIKEIRDFLAVPKRGFTRPALKAGAGAEEEALA